MTKIKLNTSNPWNEKLFEPEIVKMQRKKNPIQLSLLVVCVGQDSSNSLQSDQTMMINSCSAILMSMCGGKWDQPLLSQSSARTLQLYKVIKKFLVSECS